MAQSALIAAFLAGLVGGMHCFAMCGGYVAAVSSPPVRVPLLPLRALLMTQVIAHLGRLATYALLGTAVGVTGGLALSAPWASLQQALHVVANLLLLTLAFGIARRRTPLAGLESTGLALYAWVARVAGRSPGTASAKPLGRFALGMLWGLTPCALVYAVLPVAMLSGSAGEGALVMLAFGLGTLPNLLAAGATAARFRNLLAVPGVRSIVALVVAGFGVAGLHRALFAADALARGPFCLVP